MPSDEASSGELEKAPEDHSRIPRDLEGCYQSLSGQKAQRMAPEEPFIAPLSLVTAVRRDGTRLPQGSAVLALTLRHLALISQIINRLRPGGPF